MKKYILCPIILSLFNVSFGHANHQVTSLNIQPSYCSQIAKIKKSVRLYQYQCPEIKRKFSYRLKLFANDSSFIKSVCKSSPINVQKGCFRGAYSLKNEMIGLSNIAVIHSQDACNLMLKSDTSEINWYLGFYTTKNCSN